MRSVQCRTEDNGAHGVLATCVFGSPCGTDADGGGCREGRGALCADRGALAMPPGAALRVQ
eukprot:1578339-Lingulodinium_polyedra.AAC.1